MEKITPFQSGRPLLSEITADKLNRILAEIRRNRPVVSAPLSARVTGDGTCISLLKQPSGRTPTTRQPWDLIAFPDPESGSETPRYKIRVQPGTISNILPSNWDEEFTANHNTLYYAIAIITTDGRDITGVSMDIATSDPTQQAPQKFGIESSVEYLFGLFFNGATFNVLGRSIFLFPRLRLVTSADPAAEPGESPFDLWYELAP